MIIGLTGLAGSGKDAVAKHLSDKHGYTLLVFSDVLVEEAKSKGLETNKMNLSVLGDELRAAEGNAVIAKRIMKKMDLEKDYVLSGFRSPEEVYAIQNEVIDFHLICICAGKAARFGRRRPDDPKTEAEFFERDERDIKNKGLGKVIEMADCTIDNDSSLEELYIKIDDFLLKLSD